MLHLFADDITVTHLYIFIFYFFLFEVQFIYFGVQFMQKLLYKHENSISRSIVNEFLNVFQIAVQLNIYVE